MKIGQGPVGLGGAQPPHARSTPTRASASRRPGSAATSRCSSAIVCPLHFNDAFIGCLALYHVEANHYTEDHRRLLERIAEQAGAVIHNSIVFEQTQEDSLTDPLTGLPNRRSMFVHLSRELARAERLKSEVAHHRDGHRRVQGDQRHLRPQRRRPRAARGGDALQGALRPYDLCVRYAGDEFIVVLADCSREAAELKRRELQAARSPRSSSKCGPASGCGSPPAPAPRCSRTTATTYEALLADADHRMYRDKAARRGHGPLRRALRRRRLHARRTSSTPPVDDGPMRPRPTVA